MPVNPELPPPPRPRPAAYARTLCPKCESRGPHLVAETFDDEFTILCFDCDWVWTVVVTPPPATGPAGPR